MTLLFFSRLVLYYFAVLFPLIHPNIVVGYDLIGIWLWMVLIPAEMVIANFLAPPRLRFSHWLLSAFGIILLSVLLVSGFSQDGLTFVWGGAAAFLLTVLIFKLQWKWVSAFEIFFISFVYNRLLNFSRANEQIAADSSGFAQFTMILLIVLFILHAFILYTAVFREKRNKRSLKEVGGFFAILVPVVLAVILLLPPNFVSHNVVLNNQDEKAQPEYLDGLGNNDNGESRLGDRKDKGRLLGLRADRWGRDRQDGNGGGKSKQYAVMIIATKLDSVYAAGQYFGHFDSQEGFQLTEDNPLNALKDKRIIDTWVNPDSHQTGNVQWSKRTSSPITYFSTLGERYLAYEPELFEPTVKDYNTYPFSYSYETASKILAPEHLQRELIQHYSQEELANLAPFLELHLEPEVETAFKGYLDGILAKDDPVPDKIMKILQSFKTCQYEIGFDDNVQVEKLKRFLFNTKTGDCTEFSNTAALLARLAGIPSRVVTGYLGSKALQSPAHRRGLRLLRDQIGKLQEFPEDNLLLVTTAHRHSWVQFYLPYYGWMDFETTSYAIPPAGGLPNDMDVVIPILKDVKFNPERNPFPWKLMGVAFLMTLGIMVFGIYSFRFIREFYLTLVSRRPDLKGAKALYALLLMKLAVRGYRLKLRSKTPLEYAKEYPELEEFARLYTILRYGTTFIPGETAGLRKQLAKAYQGVLEAVKIRTAKDYLRTVFSLKGLYY